MGKHWEDGGYSANVALYLRVGADEHKIAQLGPDFFYLHKPTDICDGTEATIIIVIDGTKRECPVVLLSDSPEKPGRVLYADRPILAPVPF